MKDNREAPGIAAWLKIFGWLIMIAGILTAVVSFSNNAPEGGFAGIAFAFGSLFFFALAAIIDKLHQIDLNTRKAD